jgi:hypothetical protein
MAWCRRRRACTRRRLYELVLYVAIFIALWRQRGRGLPPDTSLAST